MPNWISGVWCKTMHRRQAMWPIHGRYLCPKCLHVFEVKWGDPYVSVAEAAANVWRTVHSLNGAGHAVDGTRNYSRKPVGGSACSAISANPC